MLGSTQKMNLLVIALGMSDSLKRNVASDLKMKMTSKKILSTENLLNNQMNSIIWGLTKSSMTI